MRRDPTLANTAVFSSPHLCLDDSGVENRPLQTGFPLPGKATVRSGERGPLGAWGVLPPTRLFSSQEKRRACSSFSQRTAERRARLP